MPTHDAQIRALLSNEAYRLVEAAGLDPRLLANHAQVFNVARAEIDAFVDAHGCDELLGRICRQGS